jgi:oligoribonuclease (3'-5' exoribonuclease)
MRYLSFDLEATGLDEHCLILEFAMIPFCTSQGLKEDLARHYVIKCPSFDDLKPTLNEWVIQHNKSLIERSHREGIELNDFRRHVQDYVTSSEVRNYFGSEKIVLFGKSMNAIDLPFLNRDLGWNFMREHFQHRVLDLSSVCYAFMDAGLLPPGMESGSQLMKYLNMGTVAHTAMEDAKNTALMYLAILDKIKQKSN